MEMVANIDVLTEKIYKEGVEKAEIESNELLEEAKRKADEIINLANEKAQRIISKASKESEVIKRNVMADIHLAGIQALNVVKQQVREMFVHHIVKEPLDKLFSNEHFLEKLILTISKQFQEGDDLEIVLPDKMRVQADSACLVSGGRWALKYCRHPAGEDRGTAM